MRARIGTAFTVGRREAEVEHHGRDRHRDVHRERLAPGLVRRRRGSARASATCGPRRRARRASSRMRSARGSSGLWTGWPKPGSLSPASRTSARSRGDRSASLARRACASLEQPRALLGRAEEHRARSRGSRRRPRPAASRGRRRASSARRRSWASSRARRSRPAAGRGSSAGRRSGSRPVSSRWKYSVKLERAHQVAGEVAAAHLDPVGIGLADPADGRPGLTDLHAPRFLAGCSPARVLRLVHHLGQLPPGVGSGVEAAPGRAAHRVQSREAHERCRRPPVSARPSRRRASRCARARSPAPATREKATSTTEPTSTQSVMPASAARAREHRGVAARLGRGEALDVRGPDPHVGAARADRDADDGPPRCRSMHWSARRMAFEIAADPTPHTARKRRSVTSSGSPRRTSSSSTRDEPDSAAGRRRPGTCTPPCRRPRGRPRPPRGRAPAAAVACGAERADDLDEPEPADQLVAAPRLDQPVGEEADGGAGGQRHGGLAQAGREPGADRRRRGR